MPKTRFVLQVNRPCSGRYCSVLNGSLRPQALLKLKYFAFEIFVTKILYSQLQIGACSYFPSFHFYLDLSLMKNNSHIHNRLWLRYHQWATPCTKSSSQPAAFMYTDISMPGISVQPRVLDEATTVILQRVSGDGLGGAVINQVAEMVYIYLQRHNMQRSFGLWWRLEYVHITW